MAALNTLYKSTFCDECGNLMMVSTQPDGSSIFRCRAVPQHTREIEADRIVMVVRQGIGSTRTSAARPPSRTASC